MKTDRELLELAAKAVNEDVEWHESGSYFYRKSCNWPAEKGFFNPLHDDGEALRLAMKLGFTVEPGKCWHSPYGPAFGEDVLDGDMKSTRRAIVRAAAAIGEHMQ